MSGAKYIVWEDYGCEGWHPTYYQTLEEALSGGGRYQSNWVLTKVVEFKVKEVDDVSEAIQQHGRD